MDRPDLADPFDACALRWYVVRTHRGQETRTGDNLSAAGIEVFCPRTLADHGNWRVARTEPLFSQYIFARFDASVSLRMVCFARGAQYIVNFGGSFAEVDDQVIAILRARVGEDGLVRIGEPLKTGDRVIIDSGPFHAMAGILERHLTDVERVMVLLTSINASMHVELPSRVVRRFRPS
jgi:transcription antitermination factor NusG